MSRPAAGPPRGPAPRAARPPPRPDRSSVPAPRTRCPTPRRPLRAPRAPRTATRPIRRNQPRTVVTGRPTNSATRRCPHPEALASNATPITVTASARRSSTLAGSNTWVRRQLVHLARRGIKRPAPRTPRSRADPHGPSRCPQPGAGHRSTPPHSAVSTTPRSTPTVNTGALPCTKTALPCPPRHAEGPSPTRWTSSPWRRTRPRTSDDLTAPGHHHDHTAASRSSSRKLAINMVLADRMCRAA